VTSLYAIAGALALVFATRFFLTAEPSRLALFLRLWLPLTLGAAGMVLTAAGKPFVGFPLVGLAVGWGIYSLSTPRRKRALPRRVTVRTAALEMQLDQATGALEGVVLAGRSEGRDLDRMDRAALHALRAEISSDPDSVRLLEAYLESRFPVGSEDAATDVRLRKARAPAPGAMTEQEAYKILGLEPGASAADIRQAHRSLVQCLGADVGGAAFLAARIDQARDFLLSLHG